MVSRRACVLAGALGALIATAARAQTMDAAADIPASCPVTVARAGHLVPPAPYPMQAPWSSEFWFGTENLWTMASVDGRWRAAPPEASKTGGYRNKSFWWRPGYSGLTEGVPALAVTGRRLDGAAPLVSAGQATNAHHNDFGGWAMLVGLDLPTTGCWEITGRYRSEAVSYVVWVGP